MKCVRGTAAIYANDYATSGRFQSVQISSVWEAQQHIRQHGAVVTRFDICSGELPSVSSQGVVFQKP
jgi:hypothetical protein